MPKSWLNVIKYIGNNNAITIILEKSAKKSSFTGGSSQIEEQYNNFCTIQITCSGGGLLVWWHCSRISKNFIS